MQDIYQRAESALRRYVEGQSDLTASKIELLRLFTALQTERQAQMNADYIEHLLGDVKYGETPIDLAARGLTECVLASMFDA